MIHFVIPELAQDTCASAMATMTELNAEFFERLNREQHTGNMKSPVYGPGGLSNEAITEIERQLGFSLPPDFRTLLQYLQDPGGPFRFWSEFSVDAYRELIETIQQGIDFDIEHGPVWLKRWGPRPATLSDAIRTARNDFADWPRLVPVWTHRFLPVDPCLPGNPVFSICQTDIIYYGATLGEYLVQEFAPHLSTTISPLKRRIPIWSDFAEEVDEFYTERYGYR